MALQPDQTAPEPLVSVITPSFNQGAYIAQTIQSVRAQTYHNIEHIVIDAQSTDETITILQEAARQGHLRFVSEPDQGMYSGINKGLRMASGDILAYLNTDDVYVPWTIETAVRRLTRDPSVGFVFGDVVRYDDVNSMGLLIVTPPFRHGHVVRRGFLTQPTVFWRRELTDRYGLFDESLAFVADCDYWMRIGERTEGGKISEILALERNHAAAKRFASPDAMNVELESVRRNHGAPGRSLERLTDRAYGYFWQVRFTALAALRVAGLLPAGRSVYKKGFGTMQPSVLRLLSSRIPLFGRRVDWNVRVPPARGVER